MTCFTPLLELQARCNLGTPSSVTCCRRLLRLLLQVKELSADKFKTCPAEDGAEALCIAQSQARQMETCPLAGAPCSFRVSCYSSDAQRRVEGAAGLQTRLKGVTHAVCPSLAGQTARFFGEAGREPFSCPPPPCTDPQGTMGRTDPEQF